MKSLRSLLLLTCLLTPAVETEAQQFQDFGEYTVHYNALNSNFIPAQVAQGYGIKRSASRALLNITVLKKDGDTPGKPVDARVTASGTNLTGQRREIDMREISDSEGAIYYIGEFPVHNLETYNFTVQIKPENETEAFELKFSKQFFTE